MEARAVDQDDSSRQAFLEQYLDLTGQHVAVYVPMEEEVVLKAL